jgi:hypothetical protein
VGSLLLEVAGQAEDERPGVLDRRRGRAGRQPFHRLLGVIDVLGLDVHLDPAGEDGPVRGARGSVLVVVEQEGTEPPGHASSVIRR